MAINYKIGYYGIAIVAIIIAAILGWRSFTPQPQPTASPSPNTSPVISATPALTPTSTPLASPSVFPSVSSIPSSSPLVSPSSVPTPKPTPLSCSEVSLGNKTRKEIALTFDAGGPVGSVTKILQILKDNNIRSSFFVTGKWAEENPELVKQIAANGNDIHNHTYSHPDLTTVSNAEIRSQLSRTESIIKDLTGKSTKPYFRTPFGARNQNVWDVACAEGYRSIYWTVDALDWKPETTAEVAKSRIFSNEKNGEIVLMHVGDDLTGEILAEVIQKLKNDGYGLVTINQILR